MIQSFLSDSLDAHGLGRKTIQFAQNYEENGDITNSHNNPSVFVLKSKLSSEDAHKMSQNDLWTYYAKELLNEFCEDQNVKYLAITNVTRYKIQKPTIYLCRFQTNIRLHLNRIFPIYVHTI